MATKKTHPVVLQEWEESERGWGCRPDGGSLHINSAALEAFTKAYWDKMPKEVPDEYSRPCGSPQIVDVDTKTYNRVKKSGNGTWISNEEVRTLLKKGR